MQSKNSTLQPTRYQVEVQVRLLQWRGKQIQINSYRTPAVRRDYDMQTTSNFALFARSQSWHCGSSFVNRAPYTHTEYNAVAHGCGMAKLKSQEMCV